MDVPSAVVAYRMRSTYKQLVRQMYIWGRQSPMLYRDFRGSGMVWKPRTTLAAWSQVPRLTVRALLRGGEHRLHASRHVAYLVGRVVGSVKFRVLFL